MKVTEHEMRGLLTGKCVPADMLVNEELSAYLVRKFAELHLDIKKLGTAHAQAVDAIFMALKDKELVQDRLEDTEDKLQESREKMEAMLGENVALKAERTEMISIGELIRNQDNRCTDQPFFAVMTKREIVASEDHDYDRICWVENQSGDYVEATETQRRRLEAVYQGKYEVREGWDRHAMKEIDVFVTGGFTEQGCKDYISRNGHNLNKPFIYAFGSYRNNEYQRVRKLLMDISGTPATTAITNELRAEGVEMFAGHWESNCAHDDTFVGKKAKYFANQLRAGNVEGGE